MLTCMYTVLYEDVHKVYVYEYRNVYVFDRLPEKCRLKHLNKVKRLPTLLIETGSR